MTSNINQAIADARKYAHGSRYHSDAMQVLYDAYRVDTNEHANSLDTLWTWVESMDATVKLTSLKTGENFRFQVGGDVDTFTVIGQVDKATVILNNDSLKLITMPMPQFKNSRVIMVMA